VNTVDSFTRLAGEQSIEGFLFSIETYPLFHLIIVKYFKDLKVIHGESIKVSKGSVFKFKRFLVITVRSASISLETKANFSV
jgi:hypothetical protein